MCQPPLWYKQAAQLPSVKFQTAVTKLVMNEQKNTFSIKSTDIFIKLESTELINNSKLKLLAYINLKLKYVT
jgi:hypothetical protein